MLIYKSYITQDLLDDCACFNSECMHSFSDAIPWWSHASMSPKYLKKFTKVMLLDITEI